MKRGSLAAMFSALFAATSLVSADNAMTVLPADASSPTIATPQNTSINGAPPGAMPGQTLFPRTIEVQLNASAPVTYKFGNVDFDAVAADASGTVIGKFSGTLDDPALNPDGTFKWWSDKVVGTIKTNGCAATVTVKVNNANICGFNASDKISFPANTLLATTQGAPLGLSLQKNK